MKMNYNTAFEHFEAFVEERVENFEIDSPELAAFIQNIINYFTEGPTTLDRQKGLLVRGAIGSGKTFTMKVIQKWLSAQKKFSFYRCQTIAEDFNKTGPAVLVEYNTEKEILFDDLGAEEEGRYFGDKQEVFEKIILHRYEVFQVTGHKSHFTTNFSNENLQKKYGVRAYDRLKDLVNVVNFPIEKSRRGFKVARFVEPKIQEAPVDFEGIRKEFIERCLEKPYAKSVETGESLELDFFVARSLYWIMEEKDVLMPSNEQLNSFKGNVSKEILKPLNQLKSASGSFSLKRLMNPFQENNLKPSQQEAELIEQKAMNKYINSLVYKHGMPYIIKKISA